MTTYLGLEHSYSNTGALKTMISDRIIMADPYDISAIVALGLDNTSKFAFVNQPHRKYEWLEDAYPPVSDTAAEDKLTDTSTTVTIVVTDGSRFHIGDVVFMDSEAVHVTAKPATNSLTVTRGYGATAQATHSSTVTMYIRYQARVEGADTADSPWTEVTTGTNYSTILHREVNMSRDDLIFPRYGIPDLLKYRIDMNMDVLMEQLNRIPYYGTLAAGAATTARSTAGLTELITTNATALSSAVLLRSHIDTEFLQIYAAGGKTDLILCDAWAQKKINDFYEGFISTERSETTGGMMIKQLMHPITGNLVKIVVDRHCRAGYMFLLDTRYVGYITIDPFFYEELSKTGDAILGQTVGEYGLVAAYNKSHSIISGYSTTA